LPRRAQAGAAPVFSCTKMLENSCWRNAVKRGSARVAIWSRG